MIKVRNSFWPRGKAKLIGLAFKPLVGTEIVILGEIAPGPSQSTELIFSSYIRTISFRVYIHGLPRAHTIRPLCANSSKLLIRLPDQQVTTLLMPAMCVQSSPYLTHQHHLAQLIPPSLLKDFLHLASEMQFSLFPPILSTCFFSTSLVGSLFPSIFLNDGIPRPSA